MDNVPRIQQNAMHLWEHEQVEDERERLVEIFATIAIGVTCDDDRLPTQQKHKAPESTVINVTSDSNRPRPARYLNDEEEFPPLRSSTVEAMLNSEGIKRSRGHCHFRKGTNATAPRYSKQQGGTSREICNGVGVSINGHPNNAVAVTVPSNGEGVESAKMAVHVISGGVVQKPDSSRLKQQRLQYPVVGLPIMKSMPLALASANSEDKLHFSHGTDDFTDVRQGGKIEELAVGNGRPLPTRNSEFVQVNQDGAHTDIKPDPVCCKLEYNSSLSFLDNGVESQDYVKSVGSQTGSTFIRSRYAPEHKGTFQVWFLPEKLSESETFERHQIHSPYIQHGQLRSHQLLDPPQLDAPTSPTTTVNSSCLSMGCRQYHRLVPQPQSTVGPGMIREFGTSPEYSTDYARYAGVTPHFSVNVATRSNGTTYSREDNQNLASSSRGNGYYGHATIGRSTQPSQEQLNLPQAEEQFQGRSNESHKDDATFELNVYRSAVQMLKAGVVPSAEPETLSHLIVSPLPDQQVPNGYEDTPIGRCSVIGRRNQYSKVETGLVWRGELLPKDTDQPWYSEKIFVGGIQHEVSKTDLYKGFVPFGVIDVSWCAMAGDKVIHGCAYVTLASREQVNNLIQSCKPWLSKVKYWKGQRTWHYDMPYSGGITQVEIILWDVNQGEYPCEEKQNNGKAKKEYRLFLGNLHARFSANDLWTFLVRLGFHDVKHIKIGMDKHEYPVGYARVTFGSFCSFIRAVRARRLTVKTSEITRILQIEPFIEGNPCSMCPEGRAFLFCRNEKCSNYYCHGCYNQTHGAAAERTHYQYHRDDDIVTRPRRLRHNTNINDNEYYYFQR